jgi:hypothetical protein
MNADDAPGIAGLNQPDGARIIVSRPAEVQGVNGPGGHGHRVPCQP